MTISPRKMSRSLAVLAVAIGGIGIVAPSVASAVDGGRDGAAPVTAKVPTYDEFYKSTYRDADGQWIVDGDMPISSGAALKAFYGNVFSKTQSQRLIVNQVNGRDDVWSARQARNLTYCVSDKFGSDKQTVIDAMEGGGQIWSDATSAIRFVYVPAQDKSCNTRNTKVVFSVEPVSYASYIARSFFPSSPKSQRNILINMNQFGSSSWPVNNILAHEMGHILGLRHEHTRPEAGTCFEDNNWRPLTPYDSSSIMHYPQCNGTSSDLSFTETDGEGIRTLYGE
ncbi:hypothetical protein KEM60_02721 [Austwickia sp. TVS 96-490-7B]|uniref:M57 family metalloprotease n=1 Tax=Austwickia sp. TVS 96-490-7B TaxID=2830843 RepID=UPI001D5F436E|nr:M57 family metalloprotease [Austwickia sp. TVS 96-490-7B]MBW3086500.1 hypothetical protein [Austwickia sp. TVS 96-490-7B]